MMFVLDTCALFDLFERVYPPGPFGQLHDRINELAEDGLIVVPRDCVDEFRDYGLANDWVKANRHVIRDVDDSVEPKLADVMHTCPKMVNHKTTRGTSTSGADPVVVATALALDAVVVSSEKRLTPEKRKRGLMKVPEACEAMGVSCMTPLEFIQAIKNW